MSLSSAKRGLCALTICIVLFPSAKQLCHLKKTHSGLPARIDGLEWARAGLAESQPVAMLEVEQKGLAEDEGEAAAVATDSSEDTSPQISLDIIYNDRGLKRHGHRHLCCHDRGLPTKPPKNQSVLVSLSIPHVQLVTLGACPVGPTQPLPHTGSGPCHDIPRPRETVIEPTI